MKSRPWPPYVGLILLCAYYCHRLYGVDFVLEGDAINNTYFRYHEDISASGFNPFQWDYFTLLPFSGIYNPFVYLSRGVVSLIPGLSRVEHAIYVNMLCSWLLLSLLACTTFAFFKKYSGDTCGAFAGTLVVSFTGFHLVGVREFNQMYLLSFAMLPVCLHYTYKLAKSYSPPAHWYWILAVAVGFSLLGGSNVPLAFYLPLLAVFPLLSWFFNGVEKPFREIGRALLAGILILILAAPVLLPSLLFLSETNRGNLHAEAGMPLEFALYTFFFRDWWANFQWHYHETDFFIGLPVIALFFVGMRNAFLDNMRLRKLNRLMFAALILGLLILTMPEEPFILIEKLYAVYQAQSIRHPARFFLLALFPIGYFVSFSFQAASLKRRLIMTMAVLLAGIFLFLNRLSSFSNLIPDLEITAQISQTFAMVAFLLLVAFFINNKRKLLIPALGALYGMYLIAPAQLSAYMNWYQGMGLYRTQPPERLQFRRVLGFYHDLSSVRASAQYHLEGIPDFLKTTPATGRIAAFGFHSYFHAPVTGHKYVCDDLEDPAGLARLRTLCTLATNPIGDMMGVRYGIAEVGGPKVFVRGQTRPYVSLTTNSELILRSNSMAEIYYVPDANFYSEGDKLLEDLKSATSEILRRGIFVECTRQGECDQARQLIAADTQLANVMNRDVRTASETPYELTYSLAAGRAGFVFLSTPFHPGWKVEINGVESPILRANYAFMAIAVDSKASDIRFVFDFPFRKKTRVVAAFAWTGVLLIGGLTMISRQRRKKSRDC